MNNDIVNTIFPAVIITNFPVGTIGRPRLSADEILRKNNN
jgi:hypothetical protein